MEVGGLCAGWRCRDVFALCRQNSGVMYTGADRLGALVWTLALGETPASPQGSPALRPTGIVAVSGAAEGGGENCPGSGAGPAHVEGRPRSFPGPWPLGSEAAH